MDARGGACRIGILAHDGGIDLLVLAGSPGADSRDRVPAYAWRRCDCAESATFEMLQDVPENTGCLWPARCSGERPDHARQCRAQGEMMLELLQSLAHDLQMGFAAALGNQTGNLGLQTDAQLQRSQHIDGLAELARALSMGLAL